MDNLKDWLKIILLISPIGIFAIIASLIIEALQNPPEE